MYVYTVTIGRNVEAEPMPDVRWATFQDDVSETLAQFTVDEDFIEFHVGRGEWGGVTEESAKFALLKDEGLSQASEIDLRRQLTELARIYDQDAIALTIGESVLC